MIRRHLLQQRRAARIVVALLLLWPLLHGRGHLSDRIRPTGLPVQPTLIAIWLLAAVILIGVTEVLFRHLLSRAEDDS
jgi:hypothetical protein